MVDIRHAVAGTPEGRVPVKGIVSISSWVDTPYLDAWVLRGIIKYLEQLDARREAWSSELKRSWNSWKRPLCDVTSLLRRSGCGDVYGACDLLALANFSSDYS